MDSRNNDFTTVTEIAGEPVSREQVQRMAARYRWAAEETAGMDILEVACGSGQGLELLSRQGRRVLAGDVSAPLLAKAQATYGNRIPLLRFDGTVLPFKTKSLDAVLLFEALYYLPHPHRFASECRRVLRPGGKILVVTANCDLFDFNPSPYSHRYFGAPELYRLFHDAGFEARIFGGYRVDRLSLRQRAFRPIKWVAVRLGAVPGAMRSKRLMRRVVFGKLEPMPAKLTFDGSAFDAPTPIAHGHPDRSHKVLYCIARAPPG